MRGETGARGDCGEWGGRGGYPMYCYENHGKEAVREMEGGVKKEEGRRERGRGRGSEGGEGGREGGRKEGNRERDEME